LEVVGQFGLAIDLEGLGVLGVEEGGVVVDGGAYAGDEGFEGLEVAVAADGEIADLLAFDLGADVGAIGFKGGGLVGDGDGLGLAAGFEGDVIADGAVDGDLHVARHRGLEAVAGDGDGVDAGWEEGEFVIAAGIGLGGVLDAGVLLGDLDVGARDGSAGGIGDGADHGSGSGLGPERAGDGQETAEEKNHGNTLPMICQGGDSLHCVPPKPGCQGLSMPVRGTRPGAQGAGWYGTGYDAREARISHRVQKLILEGGACQAVRQV
jgi:hypothetical protein